MRNHKQRSARTQYYNYNIEIAEIEDRMQHIVGRGFRAFLSHATSRGQKELVEAPDTGSNSSMA
jgi:hypothetical protein